MGRHSAAPAATPRTPSIVQRLDPAAYGPVTDPVLLDAVQEELRRTHDAAPAADDASRAPYRRPGGTVVPTAFSGEVVLPERPSGRDPLRTVRVPPAPEPPAPRRTAAARQPAPRIARTGTAPPPRRAAPVTSPVPPHPAVTTRMDAATVVTPIASVAGIPTEAPARRIADRRIGISGQSLVLSLGVGIGVAAALSIVAVLPI